MQLLPPVRGDQTLVKVDTLFVPIAAAIPAAADSQLARKEATSKLESNSF